MHKTSIKQEKRLEELNRIVSLQGGECLSCIYKNAVTPWWECSDGHTWKSNTAKYNNSWCPRCNNRFFLSEEKCRFILEAVTGERFYKNRTVIKMELDGYCDNLKTAFEYQGYQHFEHAYYYNNDGNSLKRRKFLDSKKKILCHKNNIQLLNIPSLSNGSVNRVENPRIPH